MIYKMERFAVIVNARDLLTSHPTIGRPRRLLGTICERVAICFARWALRCTQANYGLITLMPGRCDFMELTIQTPSEASTSMVSCSTNTPTWTLECGQKSSALH